MSKKNKKNQSQGEEKRSSGSLLKKAREARDFSIDHVATQMRLHADVIEALEGDDFSKLPAAIFVRGYIRTYTSLVGISVDSVMELYDAQSGEPTGDVAISTIRLNEQKVSSGDSKGKKWLPISVVVMVAILALLLWLSSDSKQDVAAPETVQQVVPENNEVVEPGFSLPADAAEMQESEQSSSQAPESMALPVEQPKPIAEIAESIVAKPPVAVKPVEEKSDNVIELSFQEDSWADIRDANGKRLLYRMARAGSSHSLSGKPPFKVLLGNAKTISFRYNNSDVDLTSYLKGKVAKFSLGKADR